MASPIFSFECKKESVMQAEGWENHCDSGQEDGHIQILMSGFDECEILRYTITVISREHRTSDHQIDQTEASLR